MYKWGIFHIQKWMEVNGRLGLDGPLNRPVSRIHPKIIDILDWTIVHLFGEFYAYWSSMDSQNEVHVSSKCGCSNDLHAFVIPDEIDWLKHKNYLTHLHKTCWRVVSWSIVGKWDWFWNSKFDFWHTFTFVCPLVRRNVLWWNTFNCEWNRYMKNIYKKCWIV